MKRNASKQIYKSIKIIKEFRVILETDYTYYCYYGGRGGGKTENIAIVLVIMAMMKEHLRILCIREIYATLRDSVRQAIIDAIYEMGAEQFFEIKLNRIICRRTSSEFIFAGMGDHFARKIKSIKGVNITWVEEASDISERSWLTLLPSVLRTPNAKMIVSFNPFREDDVVYKQFVLQTPPYNSYIKKVCYYDNPFFADSPLEEQRQHQLETLPYPLYAHIWEGEILKNFENALFDDNVLKNIYISDFDYKDLIKIVIACDPATTNKDHSNEYGIIALGKLKDGTILALKDYSKSVNPSEFATIALNAVEEWKSVCDNISIVVETNQGGDFIKHTILTKNPLIEVNEVRAGSDKIQRAIPIANLCAINQVKFDSAFDFNRLIRQMKLTTHNGFIGVKGESPDRLDAFVWGVYYLADMKSFETSQTYYKKEYFAKDKAYSFIEVKDIIICIMDSINYYVLKFDIVSNDKTHRKVLVNDSAVFDSIDGFKQYLLDTKHNALLMPQNEITYTLCLSCSTYITMSEDKLLQEHFNDIKNNEVMFDLESMPRRHFDRETGQLVSLAMQKYVDGQKDINKFVVLVNYLVKNKNFT